MLIYNARIVTPDQVIENGYMLVENGIIAEIGEGFATHLSASIQLDAQGKMLLPGLIDLHTDAMDGEISPRRGADFPIEVAFRELERRNSGCGITTVYHSMHLGYEEAEKNSRSKYTREEIFEKVFELSQKQTLINNKIHLRFELTGVYALESALELIQKGCIDLLSVMDHTPGQGQVSNIEGFVQMLMRNGFSEEKARLHVEERMAVPKLSAEQFNQLIGLAQNTGIPVASHDDDTAVKVDEMYQAGIRICEFPVSMEAAVRAKELKMSVIGGSSNVLRGGSLSGNLSIEEGIKSAAIDSLCSDYYPPSMLHAVFKLYAGGLILPEAVKLATLHPALAAGIADKTGSIETGKNADFILVDLVEEVPFISHTFVNGNISAQASLQSAMVSRQLSSSNGQ